MFLPYTIVNPLTLIDMERRLPRPGEVLVRVGDKVESPQIVAESEELPQFRIINVARELAVPPKKAREYLEIEIGDTITEGQILASRGGFGGRACRAPFDGAVTGFGRGRLLLEAPPRSIQINALLPGVVVQVTPGWGAVIETQGALIQGAWGNGKEQYGVLNIAVKAAKQPLRAKRLEPSVHGTIVVGGATLDEEVLTQAIEMQVRGIIVGGVPPNLIPRLQQVDFPVISTEGVG